MDQIDIRILSELQKNGRLSSQALADKVGLSATPCWRRVRRMEKNGLIQGSVMLLDPERLGLHVTAFAQVSLEDHHPDSVAEFDRMVEDMPEVLECHAMSGQHDYQLKVVCRSIGDYDRLLSQHILRVKAVQTVNTSFVLRTNKKTTALPLGEI
ncbi:MAG: Lrp/AsnC family transcriptional regulator [Xanthomonadales bacterium]|nr:Lrp/AsnC family transcriptional regulator [Gammaproteobacteria bacterium]NNE06440.1 Lrp/AsnC family transcriptional regulator [Xanthomonadales bacterium]NNL95834.1 Lrp/AsnC family transcriptional regulator [Xanthomonadales bacterium]